VVCVFADLFVSCCHVSGAGIATRDDVVREAVYETAVIAEHAGGAVGMISENMHLSVILFVSFSTCLVCTNRCSIEPY